MPEIIEPEAIKKGIIELHGSEPRYEGGQIVVLRVGHEDGAGITLEDIFNPMRGGGEFAVHHDGWNALIRRNRGQENLESLRARLASVGLVVLGPFNAGGGVPAPSMTESAVHTNKLIEEIIDGKIVLDAIPHSAPRVLFRPPGFGKMEKRYASDERFVQDLVQKGILDCLGELFTNSPGPHAKVSQIPIPYMCQRIHEAVLRRMEVLT